MSALSSPPPRAALLAKLFNISERRVQQLAKKGVLIKTQHGTYDLGGSVQGYIQHLEARAADRQDKALKCERQRLTKAQADKCEYENHLLRGDVMPASVVTELHLEIGAVYTACLEALPGRLAHALCGLEDPAVIKAKLFEACRAIRQLTEARLRELATAEKPITEPTGRSDGGAKATDAGSVGECASQLTPRQRRAGALAE